MRKALKEVRNSARKQEVSTERHSKIVGLFKEFILGGQDGLVNVLGVILGVAVATMDFKIILIAGLAATFAESFSMAAVAYTSAKAEEDYYFSEQDKENFEIKTVPGIETQEIYDIYFKKGFRGRLLDEIVKKIVSSKKMWLDVMMKEELGLSKAFIHPVKSAIVVGLAALMGSFIPLISFFFLPISTAIIASLIISALALFVTGAIEGKMTIGRWIKNGFQLMIIGMAAAGIGFLIGKWLGVSI
jgi:VIT1/CCC1 family predicted Fe2+/Mn2+ transporter